MIAFISFQSESTIVANENMSQMFELYIIFFIFQNNILQDMIWNILICLTSM